MREALLFDEASHTFTRGGVVVPSVTQCIGAAGLVNGYSTGAEWPRERGKRVHRAVHRLTTTSEDAALAELLPGDVPYFEAAQQWMLTAGVEVFASEELVDGIDYAGWRDLRVKLRGYETPVVVDLKSGALPAWCGLQLAAYAARLVPKHDRLAVRVLPNGEFRTQVYRRESDYIDFRSCLRIWQLQREFGIARA